MNRTDEVPTLVEHELQWREKTISSKPVRGFLVEITAVKDIMKGAYSSNVL